jgi:MurNAc alpha-1-phosphate uridylyltransferase
MEFQAGHAEGYFQDRNTKRLSQPTQITRAMILAAGLGTRFKPWTDRHPKALAAVNGKSLLQRNIEYLQQYGIADIVVNVHHFASQIIEAIAANEGWGSKITISDETEEVLETGGGLKKARPFLEGVPFVLMNVDILTDLDLSLLIRDHFLHRPLATLAVTARTTSRYFLFDREDQLCGWRNTRTGEEKIARVKGPGAAGALIPKAFSGIHVIDPAIFSLISREGKFSMVDLYLDLAADHTIRAFDHSHSLLIDVGNPESAQRAAQLFA